MAASHRIAITVTSSTKSCSSRKSCSSCPKTISFNQKQGKVRIPDSAYSAFPLFRIPYFRATLIFRSSTWRPFTCKS
jgi:hypothetical protein